MKNKLLARMARLGGLSSALLLAGCDAGVFDPKGPVGEEIKSLIVTSSIAMLIVVVPTILLSVLFAWHYRQSNTSAEYLPKWCHSNKIEVVIWGIPVLIIIFLATITYKTCHSLDPYRPLEAQATTKPVEVEVVALDWKWLFIYPEEGIATVNQLAMPVNTPVHFVITSDSVMNSFFIPRLGSMIYAMAGMQTQLHLMASEPGQYQGLSANFSGEGFSDMKFVALAMNAEEYRDWVEKVKASSDQLNKETYEQLLKPSVKNPYAFYAHVEPDMFDSIVGKYNNGMVMHKKVAPDGRMESAMSGMNMKEQD
ncbi:MULTISPECIES: ubiquinol oxidase subunit II [Acetobacter]|uniref:Ubiquinol oxidase subunit 2 n=1 Tax=Acetobacter thailandicus TaxID=1502842 RepID=A0ABT3QDU2_9PROT|nr:MULTISPECIES: ubiquinol oxidase subunit II [Acetobacter]MBS0960168.1 ubiquinol oxidase subunit II [Acetobacter thailandicus]MBS0979803.1 ubiquinol oxidase subunit II [Acetobacter thailandicus]MBS0985393.1 ubiquinol oxidase subunit II [Acetobacter thailandicus]MBS1004237.1 ubiquinol oxidase subunit II [Acetobacter thailandicus]MCX2563441.1 ubiquinol oxidase subunit II [Acetobacter thailandicus]